MKWGIEMSAGALVLESKHWLFKIASGRCTWYRPPESGAVFGGRAQSSRTTIVNVGTELETRPRQEPTTKEQAMCQLTSNRKQIRTIENAYEARQSTASDSSSPVGTLVCLCGS